MHRDRRLDGQKDGFPFVEDHPRARPERIELLDRDGRIFMPVPLEAGEVELFAIHLHPDAVVDQEIDLLSTAEPHLRHHRVPA